MAVSDKTQMVLSHDNIIMVSNCQQPPVTSSRQPLVKFNSFIDYRFLSFTKSWTSHVALLTRISLIPPHSCTLPRIFVNVYTIRYRVNV